MTGTNTNTIRNRCPTKACGPTQRWTFPETSAVSSKIPKKRWPQPKNRAAACGGAGGPAAGPPRACRRPSRNSRRTFTCHSRGIIKTWVVIKRPTFSTGSATKTGEGYRPEKRKNKKNTIDYYYTTPYSLACLFARPPFLI